MVLDLAVVITGILVALQLDGWATAREERRLERVYLERLAEDLEIESGRMDAAIQFASNRIEAARLLDHLAADPAAAAAEPARVIWAVETASWRSFPVINASVYGELQSTGRLALIRSVALRRSLAEHYTALQHDARVGLDLSAQHEYDAEMAGVLDIDELAAIEEAKGNWRALTVEPARGVAIAGVIRGRERALAQLPSLVQHHTYNIRVIRVTRSRADSIVRRIEEQLAP